MPYRFAYTRVSNPFLSEIVKFRFHPLLKIGLLRNSNFIKIEAYIDTGSQWCLFDNALAKLLGIKDYKDTKEGIPLSGIGGKQPENIGYFHKLKLVIFKDSINLNLKNSWQIETEIGFLEKPIGFGGILGVHGFLDHFSFKTNIPEGYFEIEPIFE